MNEKIKKSNCNLTLEVEVQNKIWRNLNINLKDFAQKYILATLKAINIDNYFNLIEISLLYTTDIEIKKLNSEYRGQDKSTNVLSFPCEEINYNDFAALKILGDQLILGDIVFAYETIDKEAKNEGKSFLDHLAHLIIHGTLHLLGYDHEEEDEAEIMEKLEIDILKQFNISSPY